MGCMSHNLFFDRSRYVSDCTLRMLSDILLI